MVKIIEERDGEIAIDPDGIRPIRRSKCLRTIDVTDLCSRARQRQNFKRPSDPGDLVHITYGTIWNPIEGDQKCLRIVFFVGSHGEKRLFIYPVAATLFKLKGIFDGHLGQMLGCDPQAMAEAIAEHAPW